MRLTAASAVVVGLIVVLGSIGLWLALPVAWLYVGSWVQAATDSLAAALATAMAGFVVSVAATLVALGWLSAKHGRLRKARGRRDHGNVLLEGVVILSALAAAALFAVWFLLFAGTSPIPFAPAGGG